MYTAQNVCLPLHFFGAFKITGNESVGSAPVVTVVIIPNERLVQALCRFVWNATVLPDGPGRAERVSGQVLQA